MDKDAESYTYQGGSVSSAESGEFAGGRRPTTCNIRAYGLFELPGSGRSGMY